MISRLRRARATAAAISSIKVAELADESTDIPTLLAHIADALGTRQTRT